MYHRAFARWFLGAWMAGADYFKKVTNLIFKEVIFYVLIQANDS